MTEQLEIESALIRIIDMIIDVTESGIDDGAKTRILMEANDLRDTIVCPVCERLLGDGTDRCDGDHYGGPRG